MIIFKLKLFLKSFFFAFNYFKYPLRFFWAIISDKQGVLEFKNGVKLIYDDAGSLGLVIAIYMQKIYGNDFKDRVVLDIGANRGYFTIFALAMGAKAIHSFEPIEETYKILLKNLKLNNLFAPPIYCHQFAIGSSSNEHLKMFKGKMKEDYSIDNLDDSKLFEIIKMQSLENIISSIDGKQIDVLKMNCEGSEYDILMNSPLSTLNHLKKIRMEFHNFITKDTHRNISQLTEYLSSNGFQLIKTTNQNLKHGIIWFDKVNN